MPMTIGTLTNIVSVRDTNGMISDEMIEYIVRLVLARLKEAQHADDQGRQERAIRDRMSEIEAF